MDFFAQNNGDEHLFELGWESILKSQLKAKGTKEDKLFSLSLPSKMSSSENAFSQYNGKREKSSKMFF